MNIYAVKERKKRWFLTDFAMGIIVGFVTAVIAFGIIAGFVYARNKNREAINYVREYAEKQQIIGELLEEREAGKAEEVCETQTVKGLAGVSADELSNIVIAYEPVWAIGTGKTATPDDAEAVHAFVRKVISRLYGEDAASKIIIQYGGSVKADNASQLMAMENIDGALVGGASLKTDTFVPIAKFS